MSTFLATGGAALIGSVLGAVAGYLAARLGSVTARREQVWKRVQWALELVLNDDQPPRAWKVGYRTLEEIIDGKMADRRDVQIIRVLSEVALEGVPMPKGAGEVEFVVVPERDVAPTGGGRRVESGGGSSRMDLRGRPRERRAPVRSSVGRTIRRSKALRRVLPGGSGSTSVG
jgi:hypothetical protein